MTRAMTGLALALAGVALCLGKIEIGPVEIPQSPFFGACFALAGILFTVVGIIEMRNSRKNAKKASDPREDTD